MSNLSAVLVKENLISLENRDVPEPSDNQVLIKMSSVGICGSDVHYLRFGRIGHFVLKAPMVLGHEGSGVVAKCGQKVKHLKPGDRVAIEPGVPCRRCDLCKTGSYNLCPDVQFCATPPVNGNLCQYYCHAADFCFPLPDQVSLEEGALIEPLSVAVHACRRAQVSFGDRVLICGAGPIGLVNMLTAKAFGASEVVITDVKPGKLQVAKSLGADEVFLIDGSQGDDEEALAKQVVKLFKDGRQPDKTIECSGAESSVSMAIYATRSGGTVLLVGMGHPKSNIPIVNAGIREIDVKGVFRYANCYPTAIELVASGKVNVKPLITHRFSFQQTLEAFQAASDDSLGAIKVMINI